MGLGLAIASRTRRQVVHGHADGMRTTRFGAQCVGDQCHEIPTVGIAVDVETIDDGRVVEAITKSRQRGGGVKFEL